MTNNGNPLTELANNDSYSDSDAVRIPNLAAATYHLADCERREPGVWEMVVSGECFVVRRKQGHTATDTSSR